MKLQSIEQTLTDQGTALIQTVGVSMEPMLHSRESTVVLERPRGRLSRGDVALFRRTDGQHVLHRVIRVREQDYLIRGDNCLRCETIPEDRIIGVMKGYYEGVDSAYIPREDPQYQRYVRTVGLRCALLWTKHLLGWPLRKLRQVTRRTR